MNGIRYCKKLPGQESYIFIYCANILLFFTIRRQPILLKPFDVPLAAFQIISAKM